MELGCSQRDNECIVIGGLGGRGGLHARDGHAVGKLGERYKVGKRVVRVLHAVCSLVFRLGGAWVTGRTANPEEEDEHGQRRGCHEK